MTTADSVPSLSQVREPGALLKQSNALKGGRSFQNTQTSWNPPPIVEDEFQGEYALRMLSWTQLWGDGIYFRCAIRARYDANYLAGGGVQGYRTKFACERPSWTHLVIQAATVNGLSGSVRWNDNPGAWPPTEGMLCDQLSPLWELNPMRILDPKMCRPLVLMVSEGCACNVIAE
eukprot:4500790-Alexandrium_andersonii.AAC.1